jgi:hypothetical protein
MNKIMVNGCKKKDGNVRRFVTANEFEDWRENGWERDPDGKAIPDQVVDQLIPVRMSEEAYRRYQREHMGGRQTELQERNLNRKLKDSDAPDGYGEEKVSLGKVASREEAEEVERKAAEKRQRGKPTVVAMS